MMGIRDVCSSRWCVSQSTSKQSNAPPNSRRGPFEDCFSAAGRASEVPGALQQRGAHWPARRLRSPPARSAQPIPRTLGKTIAPCLGTFATAGLEPHCAVSTPPAAMDDLYDE